MTEAASSFLEATIRTATPLALAALGETVAERAGVINIGLEGIIIAGAFGAAVGAGVAGVPGAIITAMLAGLLCAAILGILIITLHAEQIVAGTALTLLALGATGLPSQASEPSVRPTSTARPARRAAPRKMSRPG